MVQHVGEIMASANQMIRMRDFSPISIFALALFLSAYAGVAAAQSNAPNFQNAPLLLPSVCDSAITPEQQQSCENALFADIDTFADYYTTRFAERFRFCVIDPVKEKNAAFDFSGNLSFLTNCLYDTEGSTSPKWHLGLCSPDATQAVFKLLCTVWMILVCLINEAGQWFYFFPNME